MTQPARRIFLSPLPWALLAILCCAAFLSTYAWYRWIDFMFMVEGLVFFAIFVSRRWRS